MLCEDSLVVMQDSLLILRVTCQTFREEVSQYLAAYSIGSTEKHVFLPDSTSIRGERDAIRDKC